MPRCARSASTSEATVHHVMNRGVDRRPVFFGDADRVEFGRRLSEIHQRFGVTTLAYCLMGNHYHVVLRAPLADVSTAMHHLGTTYVRHTNDRVGRDGPMFRSRFVALPVGDDVYLKVVVRYVHRNSLDLPGIDHPAGYRWSSYRTYLGYRTAPDFLDSSLVLGLFDDDIASLARFTENDVEPCWPIGSATLTSVIDRELAVLTMNVDGGASIPRRSAVLGALLGHSRVDLSGQAEAALGRPSADAIRMARIRARQRLTADGALAEVLRRVEAALPPGQQAA